MFPVMDKKKSSLKKYIQDEFPFHNAANSVHQFPKSQMQKETNLPNQNPKNSK